MIKLWAHANKRLIPAGIVTVILVAVAIEGIETCRRLLFSDSDDDGLWDAGERAYGTDPHNPDTDGDFISDGLEVNKYSTNPLKIDSDGRGIDDFNEIYTYESDVSNPSDDEEIIERIPNVKTRSSEGEDGEVVALKSIYESARARRAPRLSCPYQ